MAGEDWPGAASITRLFFYPDRFKDANLRLGRPVDYARFWLASLGITALSYALFTLLGAGSWDFSGLSFLDRVARQFASARQDIGETLPPRFTPQMRADSAAGPAAGSGMSAAKMHIIGVDCATDPRKTGLALAACAGSAVAIRECTLGRPGSAVASQLLPWIEGAGPLLVALDAPLGWPAAMGGALAAHRAGMPLGVAPNELFRRHTDRVVKARLGKTPLDVGADRIARTAWVALSILGDLSRRLGRPIPLAWDPSFDEGVRAIEVYPAGTLRAHGLQKRRDGAAGSPAAAAVVLGRLRGEYRMSLAPGIEERLANEHLLDSVLCVLAAVDFLRGDVIHPQTDEEKAAARKEGWIWVREAGLRQEAEGGSPCPGAARMVPCAGRAKRLRSDGGPKPSMRENGP